MHVELYLTTTELKHAFRKEQDARLATRIRAVYLALMGKAAPEIATLLGFSRRTIQNWIHAYNKQGLAGLNDHRGRGLQCRLNEQQIQWLRQRIEEGSRPEDGVCVFHGNDIQRIIKQQFGVTYHINSIYRLLRRMGYSYTSSRPEHPKGNPQERKAFQKKSVIRSGKSVLIILE
jgi:transposase